MPSTNDKFCQQNGENNSSHGANDGFVSRTRIIRYGANFEVIGKTNPQNLSHAGAFKPVDGTLQDLAAHISNGHPWMPALLDGNGKRWQNNANSADVIALDIDGGMTIEQAMQHPMVLAGQISLGIESASSTAELNKFRIAAKLPYRIGVDENGYCELGGQSETLRDFTRLTGIDINTGKARKGANVLRRKLNNKSRRVSKISKIIKNIALRKIKEQSGNSSYTRSVAENLSVQVSGNIGVWSKYKGYEVIRICNRYFAHLWGSADPACKDASRFFFGAQGKQAFIFNENACLPEAFITDAIEWHAKLEAQEIERAKAAQRAWEAYKAANPLDDTNSLIIAALKHIDPNCDYNEWLAVSMALHGMGDHWFAEWDAWSSGATSYNAKEMASRWKSFRGKTGSPAVIFGIAKKYGFRFPKKVVDRAIHKKARMLAAKLADKREQLEVAHTNQIQQLDLTDYLDFDALLIAKQHIPATQGQWAVHQADTHKGRQSKEIWLTPEGFDFAGKTGIRLAPGLGEIPPATLERLLEATKIFYAPDQQLLVNRLRRIGVEATLMVSDESGRRPLNFDREYRKRMLVTSRKLDDDYLTFDRVFNREAGGYVLCLKSPMGTGKTTVVKAMLDKLKSQGVHVNLADIAHRVSLAKASSATYGTELYSEKSDMQLEELLQQEMGFAVTTTVDSIGARQIGAPLRALLKNVNVLILDEVESILSHCYKSVTLHDKRKLCQDIILQVIREVVNNGGMVICADANLCQHTVDLIEELVGPDKIDVVENQRFKIQADVFVAPNVETNIARMAAMLQEGKRIFVACDAVDSEKGTSTKGIEALALELEIDPLAIKRIDSHTMAIGETLDIPDEVKLLVCSPSIESGLSVTSHFDAVFAFLSGNADILSSMQMLGRVRSHCPRYVFLKGSGSADSASKANREVVDQRNDEFLTATTGVEAQATQTAQVKTWGEKNEAFLASGRNALKHALPWLLSQAQGWKTYAMDEETTKTPYQLIFAERFALETVAIAEAPAITAEQAKMLREGRDKIDETQRLSIERAGIASSVNVKADDIGIEETRHLYKKTARQFAGRNHQLLISWVARQEALNKQAKKFKAGNERITKEVAILRILSIPGIPDLIHVLVEASQEGIGNGSSEVKDVADLLRTMPEELTVLGIKTHETSSDMRLVCLVMNRLGFNKAEVKRSSSTRYYRFEVDIILYELALKAIAYMEAKVETIQKEADEIREERDIRQHQRLTA
jgi:hypothetical protein